MGLPRVQKVQYPPHVDEAFGWQLDTTEVEKVDTLAPVYLLYRGQRVAILGQNGAFAIPSSRVTA